MIDLTIVSCYLKTNIFNLIHSNRYIKLQVLILFRIKLIFDDVAPCRSVNNQNYRMYMDNFGDEEQKRISNVNCRLKAS
jgi:hypothetical protein